MKARMGFVSNSSSSSFVLDLKDEGVAEAVAKVHARKAVGLGRGTAIAVGRDAVEYAQAWVESTKEWYKNGGGLGHWILEWADKIGHDNIVFLRISDEEEENYEAESLSCLAISEREYH